MLKKLWNSIFGKLDDTSKSGTLDVNDLVKLVRNGLLVALAAGVAYVIEGVDPADLGKYGPLMVALVYPVLDTLKKWVKDNTNG